MSVKEQLMEVGLFFVAVVLIAGSIGVTWAFHPLAGVVGLLYWTGLYWLVGLVMWEEEDGDIPLPNHLIDEDSP